jgi:RNase P subunit RPR2
MYVSWTNHRVTLTGRRIQEVTCEECGTEYLYEMRRTEVGQGTSLYGM